MAFYDPDHSDDEDREIMLAHLKKDPHFSTDGYKKEVEDYAKRI